MRTSRFVLLGLAIMATLAWTSAARADLDAVAQAMGTAKVDSLQIAGGETPGRRATDQRPRR